MNMTKLYCPRCGYLVKDDVEKIYTYIHIPDFQSGEKASIIMSIIIKKLNDAALWIGRSGEAARRDIASPTSIQIHIGDEEEACGYIKPGIRYILKINVSKSGRRRFVLDISEK